MTLQAELRATISAIRAVREPRFLATERGFQGAFYCALRSALGRRNLLVDGRIVEMEYQKSERHNLSQRPDIVLHIPAEESGMSVKANNLAVWALKHSGSQSKATEDFQKLDQMCRTLCYPLAIFLNIGSCETHLGGYGGGFKDRLHAFAIPGVSGSKIKYAHFIDGGLIEKDIAL